MVHSQSVSSARQPSATLLIRLVPALAAAIYPFILIAFHAVVGPPGQGGAMRYLAAGLLLAGAFAVAAIGVLWARRADLPASSRRLAYASVAAPTAYVFMGVLQGIAGSPVPDPVLWCVLWGAAAVLAEATRARAVAAPAPGSAGHWRIIHGISGVLVLAYVSFHLFNHLFGLLGPVTHAEVMAVGRQVYRAPFIEPILVLVMLFQVASGLYLAWHWSAARLDMYRVIQIATGVYLAVFILGHMNSVFVYARTVLGIPTDWAFASGAPSGLIHDAWNIRLVPHYALGVLLVLVHLLCGLRVVMLAHGAPQRRANVVWGVGVAICAVIATAIMAGLIGVRI